MHFIMLLQFVEEREGFATHITMELAVLLLPVNHLHVFVDISRTKFLITQLALLRLGVRTEVSLDVVLQVLHLVDSPIAERTFEPGDLVVNEGMFPVSVDSLARLPTDRTFALDTVSLAVGLRDDKVLVSVSHMVSYKVGNAGQLLCAALHVTLPAPAVIVVYVTHHVAVVTEAFITTLTLEWFL